MDDYTQTLCSTYKKLQPKDHDRNIDSVIYDIMTPKDVQIFHKYKQPTDGMLILLGYTFN